MKAKLMKFLVFVIVAQNVVFWLWNKHHNVMHNRSILQVSHPQKNFMPIVLFWTTYYSQKIPLPTDLYPSSDCIFTNNRSYLLQAQLIIFFLPNLKITDLPPTRDLAQLWVIWTHAPPHRDLLFANKKSFPWFNNPPAFDRVYFNLTFTYRPDSDIPLPYGSVIPRKISQSSMNHLAEMKQAAKRKIEIIRSKNATYIAWLVSNCVSNGKREKYVEELRKLIPVDIYGKCGSKPCETRMDRKCYQMIESKYLFYLSFENSLCEHYVSEKAFNILSYNLVPITYGGANYSHHLPPRSFIDATHKSPAELGNHLKSLLADSDKYLEYLNWKPHYKVVDSFFVHWWPKIKGLTEYVSVNAMGKAIQSHLKWNLTSQGSLPKPIYVNGTTKSITLRQFLEWRKSEKCFSKYTR